MKFVCERCHTKYSIADEKVRGKVLKVRCKTCTNVITVRESGASIDEHTVLAPPPTEAHPFASARSPSVGGEAGGSARASRSAPLAQAAALSDAAAPAAAPPPRRPLASRPHAVPRPAASPDDDVEWYLAVDGVQTGPFARTILIERVLSAPRGADVHVWNADLSGWKPPGELPELAAEMARRRRSLTPVPPPPPPRRTFPGAPREPAPGSEGHLAVSAPMIAAPGGSVSGARPLPGALASLPLAESGSHSAHAALHAGASAPPVEAGMLAKENGKKNGTSAGHGGHPEPGLGLALDQLIGSGPSGSVSLAAQPATLTPHAVSALVDPASTNGHGTGHKGFAPVEAAAAAPAEAKRKPVRLLVGGGLLALTVCALVAAAVLRGRPSESPAPDSVNTVSDKDKPAAADFAGLAEKLAKEESAQGSAAEPTNVVPAAAEAPPPSIAHIEPPSPKTGRRTKRGRNQSPVSTTPPPLGQATPSTMTAEQREAASRFGASAGGREIRVQGGAAPTGARSTPVQGDISRVINNNRQGIQTCYQRALLRDNSLTSGKITVRVTIGLSGRVQKVNLDASPPFRALEPCIRDVMSRWAFPPSSEEYQTEFPVVLAGNQ